MMTPITYGFELLAVHANKQLEEKPASVYSLTMSDEAFENFRVLMYRATGIEFNLSKKQMVSGRLARRVRACNLNSFTEYYELVFRDRGGSEFQRMIDLLTTHETYFFREPKHFEFLSSVLQSSHPRGNSPFRIWSAASSTGEEAYSLAMACAEVLGETDRWELFGTDVSEDVIKTAQQAIYGNARIEGVPKGYLHRYFMKGIGPKEGTLRIVPELRSRVQFMQANLNERLSDIGKFDVIFLRNVLIYFDLAKKKEIVARVLAHLRPHGWLFIGHSESLNGIVSGLTMVEPTVYQKDNSQ